MGVTSTSLGISGPSPRIDGVFELMLLSISTLFWMYILHRNPYFSRNPTGNISKKQKGKKAPPPPPNIYEVRIYTDVGGL